jgi:hypothetical protein
MDDLKMLREMRSDVGSAPPITLARGREKSHGQNRSGIPRRATTDQSHRHASEHPTRWWALASSWFPSDFRRKGMQAAAPTISLGAKISNLGGARSSTSIRRSRQPMA